jgi:hypothetical protein
MHDSDYFGLYAIIQLQLEIPKRLYRDAIITISHKRRLFHLFHYDYFTYSSCFRNIFLRFLRLYTIVCIIFIASYYAHYFIWDELLQLLFSEPIMLIMRIIAPLFELFFCLAIITIIFFQCYHTHFFFQYTICIMSIMAIRIIRIMSIINIIALKLFIPLHTSGSLAPRYRVSEVRYRM